MNKRGGLQMKLKSKKIAILLESDFYENEIFYYKLRFEEEGAEVHFLTRLWEWKESHSWDMSSGLLWSAVKASKTWMIKH